MNALNEEIFDSMQAGAFLKMHASRVNALACIGEIKSVKVGRKRLYAKSDLLKWLRKKGETRRVK